MHKGVARWRLRCLEGKLRANECFLYQTEPYLSNSKCNGRFNSSAKSAQLSASLLPPVPGTPIHCITQPTRCSRVDGIAAFAPLFQELKTTPWKYPSFLPSNCSHLTQPESCLQLRTTKGFSHEVPPLGTFHQFTSGAQQCRHCCSM